MTINGMDNNSVFQVNQTRGGKTSSLQASGQASGQTSGQASGQSAGDSVSLSQAGLLRGLLTSFMDGAGEDGRITLDEIRAFRDKEIEVTKTQLQGTLAVLNINPSGRLQVDIDPYNNVIVSGGTAAENSVLAAALQGNDRFTSAWHAASATSSLLAASEASMSFQSAYRSDPKSAVDQYGWLFNKDWQFNLYYENGEVRYSVT